MAKLRFRKSINLGGGARLNLSSKGIGTSFGVRGARVTRRADGRTTLTTSIPKTGLSMSQTLGSSGKAKRPARNAPANRVSPVPSPLPATRPNYWLGFALNFLLPGLGLFLIGAVGWGLAWLVLGLALFAGAHVPGLLIAWVGVAVHYRALYGQRWP